MGEASQSPHHLEFKRVIGLQWKVNDNFWIFFNIVHIQYIYELCTNLFFNPPPPPPHQSLTTAEEENRVGQFASFAKILYLDYVEWHSLSKLNCPCYKKQPQQCERWKWRQKDLIALWEIRMKTEGLRLAAIPGPNYFAASPVHLYPLMLKS